MLNQGFLAACERLPAKTALVCGTQRVSYAELQARVDALAATLLTLGFKPGDRVLLLLESSIEFAVAVHAVLAAGGVFVPVSALTKADKLAYLLDDAEARVLLTQDSLRPAWQAACERAAVRPDCVVHGLTDGSGSQHAWPAPDPRTAGPHVPPAPTVPRQAEDLAAIIYTSGTTGRPKGVMLSHGNMCSAWQSVQSYLQLRESDVIGLALSPAFSYGLYHVLMGLGLGATVLMEAAAAAFPVRLLECFARERVSVFPGVPTLFASLLGLAERLGANQMHGFELASLRIVTNAAAALPISHLQRLRRLWPAARLYSMYGMTECKRISYLPPEQLDLRPGSVGRGMPGQTHWLVDEQGRRLPEGSTGELVVCGPHVMQGYWRRPEESAQRLRPGPRPGERELHTGDIFRSDAEGWLSFVARSDDVIKSRGEKVAPAEVEQAIYRLDGVLACAVIGVPDELLGQAVKAFVQLRPEVQLSARDLMRHCQTLLEGPLCPKYIEFVDELPRTDSGKIRKTDLR